MNNFKKTALSLFVIAIFVSYVFYQQRNSGMPTVPIAANENSAKSAPAANSPSVPAVKLPAAQVSSGNDDERRSNNNVNVPVASSPTPPVSIPSVPAPVAVVPRGKYKDGTYTGNSADAYYGNIQVQAVIKNGKIADVIFLDYPQDRGRSIMINNYAMPILRSEAIQAQSARVDAVSGATDSSGAFVSSLSSALSQAL